MIVLHVFRDSERDAGGWVGQKWQFQRDASIEQPLSCYIISRSKCYNMTAESFEAYLLATLT